MRRRAPKSWNESDLDVAYEKKAPHPVSYERESALGVVVVEFPEQTWHSWGAHARGQLPQQKALQYHSADWQIFPEDPGARPGFPLVDPSPRGLVPCVPEGSRWQPWL